MKVSTPAFYRGNKIAAIGGRELQQSIALAAEIPHGHLAVGRRHFHAFASGKAIGDLRQLGRETGELARNISPDFAYLSPFQLR